MKTEGFDSELRRKLLGLPAETDASDVDRIFGYVSANRPGKPGIGWGKALLYGTAGAVLTGSLLYNINQYHTNKYLYSSIDSLKQQYAASQLPAHLLPKYGSSHQSDTVYITRYRDRDMAGSQRQTEPAGTLERVDGRSLRQSINSLSDGSNGPATINRMNGPMLPESQVIPFVEEPPKGVSVAGEQPKRVTDPVATDPNRPLANSINDKVASESATLEKRVSDPGQPGANVRLSTSQGSDGPLVPTDPLSTQLGQGAKHTKVVSSEAENSEVAMDQLPESSGAVVVNAAFLPPRPLPQYALSNGLIRPVTAVPVTLGLVPKHRLHLAFPKVAVAGSSLWAGGGVSAGHDQLSTALLGEWRLNTHWSIQTGVQLTLQGDHFFSDDDFQKRTRQDFRTLYAPDIPSSYELMDISQSYRFVQLPLTVAYHYPLGHDWSLRFGVGTNINLYARNQVAFDYRGSSQSVNQGLYREPAPVSVINTVVVSAGIERQWKEWLFRASPFISPQLKPVAVVRNHTDLFWGVQAGILHRFGGP